MFTSLFAPEVQSVLDNAVSAAGQVGGPFPSPADWRDQVIYFLMVDRFNNPGGPPKHQPFDDPNYDEYQGGTFFRGPATACLHQEAGRRRHLAQPGPKEPSF
jgi:hypothetical protein